MTAKLTSNFTFRGRRLAILLQGGAVCLFTVKDIAPWLSQYSPRPGRNVIIMLCHVTTIQEMEFHHSSYPLYFGSVFSFTLLERTPLLHSRCHQHCLQCHKHGRVHHLHHHRGGGETLWSWRVLTFKPHYSDSGRSYKSRRWWLPAKNCPICISLDSAAASPRWRGNLLEKILEIQKC